jgi:AcrR family transcriptional regulator
MISVEQRRAKNHRDTGTRNRLIDAAQRCVRTRGLTRTSSRGITELAGANLASITYYFGSKENLVALALAKELQEWLQPVLDRLRESDDPALRLLAAVEVLNTTFETRRSQAPALLDAFVHGAQHATAQSPVAKTWASVREQLAEVIAELRVGGAIPNWVEPDAMAALIMAVAAGTVLGSAVEPTAINHRDIAAQFTGLLLAAATTRLDDR